MAPVHSVAVMVLTALSILLFAPKPTLGPLGMLVFLGLLRGTSLTIFCAWKGISIRALCFLATEIPEMALCYLERSFVMPSTVPIILHGMGSLQSRSWRTHSAATFRKVGGGRRGSINAFRFSFFL